MTELTYKLRALADSFKEVQANLEKFVIEAMKGNYSTTITLIPHFSPIPYEMLGYKVNQDESRYIVSWFKPDSDVIPEIAVKLCPGISAVDVAALVDEYASIRGFVQSFIYDAEDYATFGMPEFKNVIPEHINKEKLLRYITWVYPEDDITIEGDSLRFSWGNELLQKVKVASTPQHK